MTAAPPVSTALTALGVPHELFHHGGAVDSLEQAARERGQDPGQVVRSILFRLAADSYAMVLMAGPGQISWRALRRRLGQSRLRLASSDEIQGVTGYPIGAVAPFGLPVPVPVLVDEGVLAQEEISLGSGVKGCAVILRTADLMRALGTVSVGDFRGPG